MVQRVDEDVARSAAQRRAVLAERLLLDLGDTTSRQEAAGVVAQALVTIGGATGARIVQHDPLLGSTGPALVLATAGSIRDDDDEAATLTDRDSGLSLSVADPQVPPIAIERALRALARVLHRIEEQDLLLHEARTDPLTGLLNRRALDERLAEELARQHRGGGPVSLLLLDVDHFKRVNDERGHAHGDEVLRAVADAMREVGRATDVIGRIGGDEFAMLLVDTGEAGAQVAAERLCDDVRCIRAGITASVGAATAEPSAGCTVSELVRAADEALYTAKHLGRDRAVARAHAGEHVPIEQA